MTLETTIAPPSSVLFIGLGMMGSPMAAHLVSSGWHVSAYDAADEALDAFIHANPAAVRAEPYGEAAARAAVVITMLPNGEIVHRALFETGIATAMQAGALVIDMSSSSTVQTRALGKELGAMGIALVDAPVSGGVKLAREGRLSIMVGGEHDRVMWCKPLLAAMGSAIYETGPTGSGHAMKALNNFVSAAGLVATCEALLLGERFGLNPALIIDVLNVSSGRNNTTENKAKQFMLSGSFGSGFALDLMAKDLRIEAELAATLGVNAPLSACMAALWTRASQELNPGADHTEMFRYLQSLSTEIDSETPQCC